MNPACYDVPFPSPRGFGSPSESHQRGRPRKRELFRLERCVWTICSCGYDRRKCNQTRAEAVHVDDYRPPPSADRVYEPKCLSTRMLGEAWAVHFSFHGEERERPTERRSDHMACILEVGHGMESRSSVASSISCNSFMHVNCEMSVYALVPGGSGRLGLWCAGRSSAPRPGT